VKISPTVAGRVATTASKMQLRQKEELVWHHAIRIGDGNGFGTPLHIDAGDRAIAAWSLKIVVWHERKQAVGICVAIFELDYVAVGFEALNATILRGRFWNDSKEDVIFHERVQWCSVTREAVDRDSKISVCEGWMRLDQGVKLAAVGFSLQLQQDVFLVFEEGVDNTLRAWSSGEATRKKGEATSTNRHLAIHRNRPSIW